MKSKIQETLKKFDEKWGEAKCYAHEKASDEVCICDNLPDIDEHYGYADIKSFIEKEMTGLVEKLLTELEGMRKEQLDKNDPDNYGACYAIAGFNDAINKVKEKLKEL